MNYKIIAMITAVVGIASWVSNRNYEKKEKEYQQRLSLSRQTLEGARRDQQTAEKRLRDLIQSEGDLTDEDISRLKGELEKCSAELDAANKTDVESGNCANRKVDALLSTLKEREAEIQKLEQELGVKNRWTPQDIAQLDDFIDGLTMVSNLSSSQFKRNQMLLMGLLEEIKDGASINTTTEESEGQTALHIACAMGRLEEVTWLLNHGADVNILSDIGATPLDCLPRGSYNERPIRAIMYARGAKLSRSSSLSVSAAEDRSDLQPLIDRMAALRCRETTSALYQKRLLTLLPLIRDGADVDITLPETKGNTALHYACGIGSLSITRWLVEHGANVNAVTNKGVTPLDCVGSDNAQQIRALLLSRGAVRTR